MLKTVGRYELVEMIGQGGMGAVYKAFDPVLRRTVAVKLISTVLDDKPGTRERFFREARAAGQLSHRNIIVIHDLGEDAGQPFLAMEYLNGASLDVRTRSGRRLPCERAVDLIIDVCGALEYAHQRGIVHRDIKPANLFLTDGGEVKILDFGLAHLISSELTRSEAILGTANYMAPEQVRGERVDRRADLFATGAVLYELLTGRKAFEGDSFANTLYQVLEAAPEPVHIYDPTIPLPLAAVVERALAKARENRQQTAAEMARELVISRESLKPHERYAVMLTATPATAEAPAPDADVPARAPDVAGRPPSKWRGIDMPVGPPQSAGSVAWSPRRVRTTAIVGVTAMIVSAVLLLPGGEERASPAPRADAAAPVVPPPVPTAPPVETEVRPDKPTSAPPPARVPERQQSIAEREPPRRPARRPSAAAAPAVALPTVDPQATADARAHAETAIARIGAARTLAAASDSASLAGTTYRAALGIEGEARGLYVAQEFARAATRAADAEAMYRTAELEARAEAAQRAREQERIRTAEALPAPAVAEPATDEPVADPRDAIRGAVARYVAALEARSLDALKAVWPSLGAAQELAIRTEFDNMRSVQVRLVDPRIEVNGDTASVVAQRQYDLVTVDGQRLASRSQVTMRLRRSGNVWTIENVTYRQ